MNTQIFLQIIRFIFGLILIGCTHITATYLLPWPFSTMHTIFIALVMLVFLYEHGSIVWFAAILFLLLDFVSIYPFGLVTIAGVMATTIMLLLYRHVFTNRSLLAAIALLIIGYVSYRTIYLIYTIAVFLFGDHSFDSMADITMYVIELITTIGGLTVVYFITAQMSYQLQHTTIQESWFRTLRRE